MPARKNSQIELQDLKEYDYVDFNVNNDYSIDSSEKKYKFSRIIIFFIISIIILTITSLTVANLFLTHKVFGK